MATAPKLRPMDHWLAVAPLALRADSWHPDCATTSAGIRTALAEGERIVLEPPPGPCTGMVVGTFADFLPFLPR